MLAVSTRSPPACWRERSCLRPPGILERPPQPLFPAAASDDCCLAWLPPWRSLLLAAAVCVSHGCVRV